MNEGIEKAIWTSIEKSGLPLELEVFEIIRKSGGWDPLPKQSYLDPDLGKGREVDLHATRYDHNDESSCSLEVRLVIQCKKIPGNAWVFFPAADVFGSTPSCDVLDFVYAHQRSHEILEPFDMIMDKNGFSHYHEVILDKSRSNGKVDNLFEAVITVTKATMFALKKEKEALHQYLGESFGEGWLSVEAIKSKGWLDPIRILQPLIVFDGALCRATLGAKRTIDEVPYVRLISSYQSKDLGEGHFPIEICTLGYLPRYLRSVESRLRKARRLADKKDEKGSSWAMNHLKEVERYVRDLQEFAAREYGA